MPDSAGASRLRAAPSPTRTPIGLLFARRPGGIIAGAASRADHRSLHVFSSLHLGSRLNSEGEEWGGMGPLGQVSGDRDGPKRGTQNVWGIRV